MSVFEAYPITSFPCTNRWTESCWITEDLHNLPKIYSIQLTGHLNQPAYRTLEPISIQDTWINQLTGHLNQIAYRTLEPNSLQTLEPISLQDTWTNQLTGHWTNQLTEHL